MGKQKTDMTKVMQKIDLEPTQYHIDFRDTPMRFYSESLSLLFNEPSFIEQVDHRNRLRESASRLQCGTSAMASLLNAIRVRDKKLAELIYVVLVQANVHAPVTMESLPYNTILRYFVDYSRDGMRDRVNRLLDNLNKMMFLADMLESVLVDIRADMHNIFDDTQQYIQFDTIEKLIKQLKGFMTVTRTDEDTPESRLFIFYADSIGEYLDKRLKTYSAKFHKLHPVFTPHTTFDIQQAIGQFFETDKLDEEAFVSHPYGGGAYINAPALWAALTPYQQKKLTDAAGRKMPDEPLAFSLLVSDIILSRYRKPVQE